MNTKHILIAALLAGAFAPALARSDEDAGGPAEVRHERFIINGQDVGHMAPVDHERFGGGMLQMRAKGVKNAPYSAEIVSEQQQNLADGNQIVNKTSSMSYRDSAGRTRHEIRDAGGALRSVTINDAVEGTTYILNPETKTATKIGPRREMARLAGDKARERISEMRKDGEERVIVKRIERDGNGPLRQRIREDVRIQVRKELGAEPRLAALERIGPVIAGAFGDMKWAAKASVKDLGTKEIDGIKAQGKMKSYEIPAGEIGNRNAIVVASESWYSPELQVTLLTRRSDPRTGERSWRMAGIKRDEPAPALFTVPSDYAVKDVMARLKKIEKIDKK
jgi:hypothetical protein